MNSIIRPCTVKDCKVILQLIKEIAVHYRVPPTEVKVTLEALREDGFGAQPQFDCYVAELPPRQTNKEGGIVGYVLSSYTYSAWKGRNLYVDNLYVQPQFRGRQIGKRLIEKAAQEGATFHKALDQVKTTPKALREDGFGRHPKFGCLVAEVPPDHRSKDGHTVVGYQFHYFSYCTWQGRIVFGEDLYVMPEFRGKGIGTSLLSQVAKVRFALKFSLSSSLDCVGQIWGQWAIAPSVGPDPQLALAHGCTQFRFVSANWNQPATALYKKLGAVDVTARDNWFVWHIEGQAMGEMAKRATQ
ncbi:thialysine N-epsilon-acetyltransferase-like isoform X2 [Dermochelys coriacea]|uniref:thialysine N-epsilon-acetyltransferase-like isoform X2 n=1 Tax=Dermochelys coriacea TaxID=27794 RepID=UPI001CA8D76B|nr:thialysine N-epsilon-acetyltransferase-like isoform X2 [Dermochelys coriacea]